MLIEEQSLFFMRVGEVLLLGSWIVVSERSESTQVLGQWIL
tara:strand:+ start:7372 stop:7494 length:123 start_codon:yes stop_codon:yes gene_type:complete